MQVEPLLEMQVLAEFSDAEIVLPRPMAASAIAEPTMARMSAYSAAAAPDFVLDDSTRERFLQNEGIFGARSAGLVAPKAHKSFHVFNPHVESRTLPNDLKETWEVRKSQPSPFSYS